MNKKISQIRIKGVNYDISKLNSSASISNLNIDSSKNIIYSNLSSRNTLTINGEMTDGQRINVICRSISPVPITIDIDDKYNTNFNGVIILERYDIILLEITKYGDKIFIGKLGIKGKFPEAGDIVLYKTSSKSFEYVKQWDLQQYASGYVPVGVVVIPKNHNVYGNEKCGIISLKESLNFFGPTRGQGEKLGSINSDSVELNNPPNMVSANVEHNVNFSHVTTLPADSILYDWADIPYIGSNTTGISDGIKGFETFYVSLPSDNKNFITTPDVLGLDGISHYWNDGFDLLCAPSPYKANGDRNPDYYLNTTPGKTNSFSDFNGKNNTKLLLEHTSDFDAAEWCNKYSNIGIGEGNWYLPSFGELGYFIVRMKLINDSLIMINKVFGDGAADAVRDNQIYWSSTKYASDGWSNFYVRYMQVVNGGTNAFYGYELAYTRAFAQL